RNQCPLHRTDSRGSHHPIRNGRCGFFHCGVSSLLQDELGCGWNAETCAYSYRLDVSAHSIRCMYRVRFHCDVAAHEEDTGVLYPAYHQPGARVWDIDGAYRIRGKCAHVCALSRWAIHHYQFRYRLPLPQEKIWRVTYFPTIKRHSSAGSVITTWVVRPASRKFRTQHIPLRSWMHMRRPYRTTPP